MNTKRAMRNSLVRVDPKVMSGTPCFVGTRMPIRTLTNSLAAGDTIEDFLDAFPGVSREQALAVLEAAAAHMAGTAVLEGECIA